MPGATTEEWDLPDPAGKPIEVMQDIRDKIEAKVNDMINQVNE